MVETLRVSTLNSILSSFPPRPHGRPPRSGTHRRVWAILPCQYLAWHSPKRMHWFVSKRSNETDPLVVRKNDQGCRTSDSSDSALASSRGVRRGARPGPTPRDETLSTDARAPSAPRARSRSRTTPCAPSSDDGRGSEEPRESRTIHSPPKPSQRNHSFRMPFYCHFDQTDPERRAQTLPRSVLRLGGEDRGRSVQGISALT